MYPKRSNQSKSKPAQSLRLVELLLKKYCISRTEATHVILEIKRQNGSVLKGLKCRVFFKMAGRIIRTVQLKKNQKERKERKKRTKLWKKTCPLCYMRFAKNYNRDRHLKNIHNATSDTSVADSGDIDSPETCLDPTKFVVSLIIEIFSNVVGKDKESSKVKCPECEKTFAKHSTLKRHLMQHESDHHLEYFQCNLCKYKTARKDTLLKHKRGVHNIFNVNLAAMREGGENLTCKMCGQLFGNDSYSFETHLIYKICQKVDTNLNSDGRHQCEICECSYSSKDALSRHINWKHTPGGKFICDICDKEYSNQYSLKRHTSSKHDEN